VLVCEAVGCGASLPVARTGTPNDRERECVDVPYPPPAARVETVPPIPEHGAVWVDGQWSWNGKRWDWQPGGWVRVPQEEAYFARWTIAVRPDAPAMRFCAGSWHAPDGARLPKPRVLAGATTTGQP